MTRMYSTIINMCGVNDCNNEISTFCYENYTVFAALVTLMTQSDMVHSTFLVVL